MAYTIVYNPVSQFASILYDAMSIQMRSPLQEVGLNVAGPVPADSVFNQAIDGRFDVVLAMYHDQGLGPLKLHAFGHAVNVTLGLPLIRTSVDHGTAFDIAGRGCADAGSMGEAIRLAAKLAQNSRP